jgi:hypothetical protein
MKIRLVLFAGAAFTLTVRVGAGTMELQPKETTPPTITQSEPWQFTIAAPGWLAGLDGTIGVRGINADIDIGFDQIAQHLDMIFAARAQAQKGPFGIYGELIYIGLSDGAQINGLINNVHEQVDQTLVDGALKLAAHQPAARLTRFRCGHALHKCIRTTRTTFRPDRDPSGERTIRRQHCGRFAGPP